MTLPAQRQNYLPFGVEVVPDRERILVAPYGEVDIATVDQVRSSLEELEVAGFKQIVLDLRQVTFLDSTGLRLVLAEVRKEGIDFAVIRGPDAVHRVFEITGLLDVIPFVER
jgi:anti-sigma B factor antagonist